MTLYDMMTSLPHDILTFVAGQVVTLYDMMTSLWHKVMTLYDMMTSLPHDILTFVDLFTTW